MLKYNYTNINFKIIKIVLYIKKHSFFEHKVFNSFAGIYPYHITDNKMVDMKTNPHNSSVLEQFVQYNSFNYTKTMTNVGLVNPLLMQ